MLRCHRLLDLATMATVLRDALVGDPRLGPLASRLCDRAIGILAEVADRARCRHELLQLADLVRDATRDDPRLAPRTIRMRALVNILLGDER